MWHSRQTTAGGVRTMLSRRGSDVAAARPVAGLALHVAHRRVGDRPVPALLAVAGDVAGETTGNALSVARQQAREGRGVPGRPPLFRFGVVAGGAGANPDEARLQARDQQIADRRMVGETRLARQARVVGIEAGAHPGVVGERFIQDQVLDLGACDAPIVPEEQTQTDQAVGVALQLDDERAIQESEGGQPFDRTLEAQSARVEAFLRAD